MFFQWCRTWSINFFAVTITFFVLNRMPLNKTKYKSDYTNNKINSKIIRFLAFVGEQHIIKLTTFPSASKYYFRFISLVGYSWCSSPFFTLFDNELWRKEPNNFEKHNILPCLEFIFSGKELIDVIFYINNLIGVIMFYFFFYTNKLIWLLFINDGGVTYEP